MTGEQVAAVVLLSVMAWVWLAILSATVEDDDE